tara:strand:+ start:3967 stop:4302 length:336 start_codon:yes stop_codon:yes gene_type:complete
MGNAWGKGFKGARHFQLREHWDDTLIPGESCVETKDEVLAEIEEVNGSLEETYQHGTFVPIPKPSDGTRVKVTMGRACVFVESDGQMTLWDANNESVKPESPTNDESVGLV